MRYKFIDYYKWYIEMDNGKVYEVYTTFKTIPDTVIRLDCLDTTFNEVTINLNYAKYWKRFDGIYHGTENSNQLILKPETT